MGTARLQMGPTNTAGSLLRSEGRAGNENDYRVMFVSLINKTTLE